MARRNGHSRAIVNFLRIRAACNIEKEKQIESDCYFVHSILTSKYAVQVLRFGNRCLELDQGCSFLRIHFPFKNWWANQKPVSYMREPAIACAPIRNRIFMCGNPQFIVRQSEISSWDAGNPQFLMHQSEICGKSAILRVHQSALELRSKSGRLNNCCLELDEGCKKLELEEETLQYCTRKEINMLSVRSHNQNNTVDAKYINNNSYISKINQ